MMGLDGQLEVMRRELGADSIQLEGKKGVWKVMTWGGVQGPMVLGWGTSSTCRGVMKIARKRVREYLKNTRYSKK